MWTFWTWSQSFGTGRRCGSVWPAGSRPQWDTEFHGMRPMEWKKSSCFLWKNGHTMVIVYGHKMEYDLGYHSMGVPHFQSNPLPNCHDWPPLAAEESRAEETLLLCETFRVASRRGKAAGRLLHVSRRVKGFVVLGQLVDPVDPRNDPRNGPKRPDESWGTWIWALGVKAGVEEVRTEGSEGSAWQDWQFAESIVYSHWYLRYFRWGSLKTIARRLMIFAQWQGRRTHPALYQQIYDIYIYIWMIYLMILDDWNLGFTLPHSKGWQLPHFEAGDNEGSDPKRWCKSLTCGVDGQSFWAIWPFVTASSTKVMFERSFIYRSLGSIWSFFRWFSRTQVLRRAKLINQLLPKSVSAVDHGQALWWTMVCQSCVALMEVLLNQMPSQVYSIYSFEKI